MEPLETADQCPRCAIPLPTPAGLCPHCHDRGVPFISRVLCLNLFRGPMKQAIHQAKYHRSWPLVEKLSDRLNARRDLGRWLEGVDALLPVPLHSSRQRQRGFNQAELIARRIRHHHPWMKIISPVVRTRATQSQTQLGSRAKRQKNMQDAFALSDTRPLHGKHLVLVDDVMTSGATLISVARVLQAAGPAKLSALVLCVADPKGQEFEVI